MLLVQGTSAPNYILDLGQHLLAPYQLAIYLKSGSVSTRPGLTSNMTRMALSSRTRFCASQYMMWSALSITILARAFEVPSPIKRVQKQGPKAGKQSVPIPLDQLPSLYSNWGGTSLWICATETLRLIGGPPSHGRSSRDSKIDVVLAFFASPQ